MTSENIIRAAEHEAVESDMKFRHGCIIYDKHGIVIAAGHNRRLTYNGRARFHPFHRIMVKSVHAEIAALIRAAAPWHCGFRDMKIYVHRLGGGNSKPCDGCFSVMLHMGIRPQNIDWSGKDRIEESQYGRVA